jgi:phage gp36-like protein
VAAYATPYRLSQLGVGAKALTDVPTSAQEEALETASRFVDGYLDGAGYAVPIDPANSGDAVARAVCIVAAYDLMTTRGYSPSQHDEHIRMRYLDILAWLDKVAEGNIGAGVTDPNQATIRVPEVFTDTIRGWTQRGSI